MSLSALIITKNRPVTFKRTVDSLLAENIKPQEIVVVDSGDTDETHNLVHAYQKQQRVKMKYRRVESKGISYSLNRGIEMCTEDIIGRIDDDEYTDGTWIANILSTFKKYPNAKAVTGALVPTYPNNYWNQVWREILREMYSYTGTTSFVFGSNAAYKKTIFTRDKFYFNEQHRGTASDDSYISYKLLNRGYQIIHNHKIRLFHDFRTSFLTFFRQWMNYGISDYHLWKQHTSIIPELSERCGLMPTNFDLILYAAHKIGEWKNYTSRLQLNMGLWTRSLAFIYGVAYAAFTKHHSY